MLRLVGGDDYFLRFAVPPEDALRLRAGLAIKVELGTLPYPLAGRITRIAPQLDAASQALALIVSTGGEATRINSVNFSIEDDSQLVRDARSRAFNDAKDRAQQYAQLSGLKLGNVISISESAGATPPTPVQAPRAAMAPVPLEPGQQTVGFSVTVIWELT